MRARCGTGSRPCSAAGSKTVRIRWARCSPHVGSLWRNSVSADPPSPTPAGRWRRRVTCSAFPGAAAERWSLIRYARRQVPMSWRARTGTGRRCGPARARPRTRSTASRRRSGSGSPTARTHRVGEYRAWPSSPPNSVHGHGWSERHSQSSRRRDSCIPKTPTGTSLTPMSAGRGALRHWHDKGPARARCAIPAAMSLAGASRSPRAAPAVSGEWRAAHRAARRAPDRGTRRRRGRGSTAFPAGC